mgnify:CR=1 FL=1
MLLAQSLAPLNRYRLVGRPSAPLVMRTEFEKIFNPDVRLFTSMLAFLAARLLCFACRALFRVCTHVSLTSHDALPLRVQGVDSKRITPGMWDPLQTVVLSNLKASQRLCCAAAAFSCDRALALRGSRRSLRTCLSSGPFLSLSGPSLVPARSP